MRWIFLFICFGIMDARAQQSRTGSLSLEFGRIRTNHFTESGSHALTWQLSYMKPFKNKPNSGLYLSAGHPYGVKFPFHSVHLYNISGGLYRSFETRLGNLKVTHRFSAGMGMEWMNMKTVQENYLHMTNYRGWNSLRLSAAYDMQIWVHKNFSIDLSLNYTTQIRTGTTRYAVPAMLTPTIGFTWYLNTGRKHKTFEKISQVTNQNLPYSATGFQKEFWQN